MSAVSDALARALRYAVEDESPEAEALRVAIMWAKEERAADLRLLTAAENLVRVVAEEREACAAIADPIREQAAARLRRGMGAHLNEGAGGMVHAATAIARDGAAEFAGLVIDQLRAGGPVGGRGTPKGYVDGWYHAIAHAQREIELVLRARTGREVARSTDPDQNKSNP